MLYIYSTTFLVRIKMLYAILKITQLNKHTMKLKDQERKGDNGRKT